MLTHYAVGKWTVCGREIDHKRIVVTTKQHVTCPRCREELSTVGTTYGQPRIPLPRQTGGPHKTSHKVLDRKQKHKSKRYDEETTMESVTEATQSKKLRDRAYEIVERRRAMRSGHRDAMRGNTRISFDLEVEMVYKKLVRDAVTNEESTIDALHLLATLRETMHLTTAQATRLKTLNDVRALAKQQALVVAKTYSAKDVDALGNNSEKRKEAVTLARAAAAKGGFPSQYERETFEYEFENEIIQAWRRL